MDSFWTQPGSKGVYIYFICIVLLIIIYSLILGVVYGLNAVENDILNTKVFHLPVLGDFGGWSMSHVIAFYIAGFLFPQQWVLIFILGVLWEFIEVTVGWVLYKSLGTCANVGNRAVLYGNKWLDGKLSDIWYNTIGLTLGYLTVMTIRENKKK